MNSPTQLIPTPISHDYIVQELDYDPTTGRFFKKGRRDIEFRHKISGGRYVGVGIAGKVFRRGRLAWFYMHGTWPFGDIDHINGNRYDDRIENLRDVTKRDNNSNLPRHRNGYLVGTTYTTKCPTGRPWHARIKSKGKDRTIGYFATQQEAHEAYLKAKEELCQSK